MNTTETPEFGGGFLWDTAASSDPFLNSIPEDAAEMAAAIEKFVRAELPTFTAGLKAHERGLMPALLKRSGDLGLLGIAIPEEFGGLALPFTYQALIAEKTAINPPFSVSAGVTNGLAALPILLHGTTLQKERWLPKLAAGEIFGAFALTEEDAGSSAFQCHSVAEPSEDGSYLLNGTKQWISNGAFANIIVLFAMVPGSGLSAFVVDSSLEGVSHGKEEHKIGLKGSSTTRLTFENVLLPPDCVLGEPGMGAKIAADALNLSRVLVAANAVGLAKEALAIAAKYAGERRQAGKVIGQHGLIRQKMGRCAARIYAAESALYHLCSEIEGLWAEDPHEAAGARAIECALVKVLCTEALAFVADETVQILGGCGCSEEFAAAGIYRDARIYRIFYGTSEINRLQAIKLLLKPGTAGLHAITRAISLEFGHNGQGTAPALQRLEELSEKEPEVESALSATRPALASADYTRLSALCAAAVVKSIPNLDERQELAASLADMLIAAYAARSIAERMRTAGKQISTATAASRWCSFTCSFEAWRILQAILASRWHGPTEATHVRRWRDLFEPPTEDLYPLELSLGDAVLQAGKYPI
jgi:alkylation response protein AidB-like acyl-CoA dehydrogenase